MKELNESNHDSSALQEMTIDEVNSVGGAGFKEAGAVFGLAAGIGTAAFGTGWGAVGVAAAFALAPCTVIALAALGGVAGYAMLTQKSLNTR